MLDCCKPGDCRQVLRAGGGQGPQRRPVAEAKDHKQNFLFLAHLTHHKQSATFPHMTFHSLPYDPRPLEATEARLEAIYAAAKMGLKGDSLALAAGMTPVEYRRLCQMDPIAEYAEQKGRADGEMEMATTLYTAAQGGDANAALNVLRYSHGWVAKQAVEVSIEQKISITAALEQARQRIIDITPTLEDTPSIADASLHR